MKKKQIAAILLCVLTCALAGGCAGEGSKTASSDAETNVSVSEEEAEATEADETDGQEDESDGQTEESKEEKSDEEGEVIELADGIYTVEFHTDNSMFRVSEACDGKGTLTVQNGEMTVHVSLGSKNIVNLYSGLAEDAQKEGANLLMPTEDTVTYSDGMTEQVYGFDIPVPVLEKEFDVALIGKKGKWYDHKVSVTNPLPVEETGEQSENPLSLEDGTYSVAIGFEGGSGKAEVLSPTTIVVVGDNITARIEWSSPNYDYMLVGGEKYLPVSTEGNSVFEIPVPVFDEPIEVIGDTVAMSTPHEVTYLLTFHSDTIKAVEE